MIRHRFPLIVLLIFFFFCYVVHPNLHSFPTRRSSDLYIASMKSDLRNLVTAEEAFFADSVKYSTNVTSKDRKSTRLNSRHRSSSYAAIAKKLVTLNVPGGGWDATMTNNNLTGGSLVTCSIFVNEAADPAGIAQSEGAPACK